MTTLEDDKLTGECQMPMTNVDRISVLDLQVRLAQKATGDPSHRFGDLYDLLSWETVLDEAATRLLGNKGSRTPGLDSVTRRVLMP